MHAWTFAAAVTVLLATACGDREELPQVRPPGESSAVESDTLHLLSEVDREVIAAVVDQRFAWFLEREGFRADVPSPVVVLSDLTVSVPPVFSTYLERHPEWGTNLTSLFWVQNVWPRLMTLPLGEKAVLISLRDYHNSTGGRRFSKFELLQAYPLGSKFFEISAPVYPTTGGALLFFHSPDSGGGFVYLVRSDNRWLVKGGDGWTE